ncbi:TetR/AcrR family transcriptional regulator C-terminal domain-containing protein [Plantactinospora sp. S1510]|uniref:TetR/AcrR family transcriptional regulator C-terminal domain-containing protein n=1 Tax=Plantactinospora alkalitolerans TaxID=2789879 RepID=A0ABS0H3W0_9ACTN|nr:TetR/AcrR family transcriptional regulator C-terminal domain-containing protein [Plantactinospora alkalitolerans]MBF9132908.1 TetR/AcrR family transcriptional regulator C-terminal domain-containing protein [Plantactinospora alkalitolerans]
MTRPDPPYLRIVAEIRRRIGAGELGAGDQVPSTRQIMQQWGVAMATASKVLTVLRHEGLVRAEPGRGTVVVGGPERPRPDPAGALSTRTPRRRSTGRTESELTQPHVVRAAIEIADTEGLPATTMRRLATELQVATMSLYRHVRGKDHLVVLMADAAFGEAELPDPAPSGWRAQLEYVCRLQWSIYRRHPWLSQVVSLTRPLLAPNAMAHTEWTMRAVSGRGLDLGTVIHVAATTANYVRGTAVNLEREAEAEQDTGITDDEWMRTRSAAVAAMFSAGAFPLLASSANRPDVDLNLDSLFEFGLQRLLDGMAPLFRP